MKGKGAMLIIGVGGRRPRDEGGPPDFEPPPAKRPPRPAKGKNIPAEAVGYRAAEERCGNCAHFGGPGRCEMGVAGPIGEDDSCNLFMGGGEAGEMMGEESEEMPV